LTLKSKKFEFKNVKKPKKNLKLAHFRFLVEKNLENLGFVKWVWTAVALVLHKHKRNIKTNKLKT